MKRYTLVLGSGAVVEFDAENFRVEKGGQYPNYFRHDAADVGRIPIFIDREVADQTVMLIEEDYQKAIDRAIVTPESVKKTQPIDGPHHFHVGDIRQALQSEYDKYLGQTGLARSWQEEEKLISKMKALFDLSKRFGPECRLKTGAHFSYEDE